MAFYPPSGTSQQLALTANVQLDYPYSANVGNLTVTDVIDVSASVTGLNIFLPNATGTGNGFSITFNNVGANDFDIVLNDAATVLSTVAAGEIKTIYLYANNSANGNWRVIPFGGGVNAISSLDLISSDNSVVINNGSITPPGGSIDITLPDIVSALEDLTAGIPGILVIDQNNPTLWNTAILASSANIDIANAGGVNGNPTISLKNTVAITQLTAGNVIINNDLITNINSGEILNIVSNGTNSYLNLNSVLVDAEGNVNDINNLTINGTLNVPNASKCWCRFTNTSGVIVVTASYNVTNVTYDVSTKQYSINFTNNMSNTNYAVFITCANNNSTPPLQSRIGYDVIRQQSSVKIVLADASGEILADIPEGVSVVIFS